MKERRKLWISMSVALFGTTTAAAEPATGLPDDPTGASAVFAEGEGGAKS